MHFLKVRIYIKVRNLEEENKKTEEQKKPEVDLVDEQGKKEETVKPEEEKLVEEKEAIKVEEEKPVEEEKTEVKEEEKPIEEVKESPKVEKIEPKEPKEPREPILKRALNFYDKQYKKLMIIPILMLILALIVIGVQTATIGSFIHKDVSLSGGVTLTITKEGAIDIIELESFLESEFSNNDVSVRSINKGGNQIGVVVAADIEGTNKDELDYFIDSIESGVGYELSEGDYSIEVMGGSLGASFFKETFIALLAAFVLMSLVVLIYFRSFIPSLGVILAAFSDIIVTVAIVDLMGMKLSTGGIAAFLMLIGYSVDTNVLVKTGMMMTLTTMGALIVGIIFVQSAVIKQIMIIVLIGLIVDMINTWIQNVGILRYYIERKSKVKNEQKA